MSTAVKDANIVLGWRKERSAKAAVPAQFLTRFFVGAGARGDQGSERPCRLTVRLLDGVGVYAEGRGRVRVSEPATHRSYAHASHQQPGGSEVPGIVQPYRV